MKLIAITILFFCSIICLAQSDTIYLFKDSIRLSDKYYNRITKGKKEGKWLEYKTTPIHTINFDPDDNTPDRIISRYSYTNRIYGAMDYDTIAIVISLDGETFESKEYVRFLNEIPPDRYRIKGIGKYFRNKKDGIWEYSNDVGTLKSKIEYSKGKPIKDFTIFHHNGSPKYHVKRKSKRKWEVYSYGENKKLIKHDEHKLSDIEFLY